MELVHELQHLGILTRNARELAHVTLKAMRLADCFAADDVLGRDEAPKPHPGGLLKLAENSGMCRPAIVTVGR